MSRRPRRRATNRRLAEPAGEHGPMAIWPPAFLARKAIPSSCHFSEIAGLSGNGAAGNATECCGLVRARLLVRATRRTAPTDAGAAYVASARRILDEIDETERIAAGEFHVRRGELFLAAAT